MMSDDQNDKIKKLEDSINDLTLVVGMYVHDYPFDDDHKVKQQMLVNYAHMMIGLPVNSRARVRYVGVECVGNDLVKTIITEEEAKCTLDVFDYLINKCNYSEETDPALINISKQINNQIEYEPSKGI